MGCHVQLNGDRKYLKPSQYMLTPHERDVYRDVENWSSDILEVSTLYGYQLNITNFSKYKEIVKDYWENRLQ